MDPSPITIATIFAALTGHPRSAALKAAVLTPRGDASIFAEIERGAANAGFARSELFDLAPTFHRVVVSTK